MNSQYAQAPGVLGSISARIAALVLAVVAITQPYWNYSGTVGPSGSWAKMSSDFYRDRVFVARYSSFGLQDQKVVYYTSTDFGARNVAAVMGNETWLIIALAALAGLGAMVVLARLRQPQLRPVALMLDILLLMAAVGAPAYLAITIGQAANTDLSHSISGFQGSATSGGGFVTETWGPTYGWFLVVGASVSAMVGIVLGHKPTRAGLPASPGP